VSRVLLTTWNAEEILLIQAAERLQRANYDRNLDLLIAGRGFEHRGMAVSRGALIATNQASEVVRRWKPDEAVGSGSSRVQGGHRTPKNSDVDSPGS